MAVMVVLVLMIAGGAIIQNKHPDERALPLAGSADARVSPQPPSLASQAGTENANQPGGVIWPTR